MDNELEARSESRRIPKTSFEAFETTDNAQNKSNQSRDDEIKGSIDADAHILNNLLESMDASAGGSGPVINILKEMEYSGSRQM